MKGHGRVMPETSQSHERHHGRETPGDRREAARKRRGKNHTTANLPATKIVG